MKEKMNKDEIITNLCYLIENDLKRLDLSKKTSKLDYYFIINDNKYNMDITIEKSMEDKWHLKSVSGGKNNHEKQGNRTIDK